MPIYFSEHANWERIVTIYEPKTFHKEELWLYMPINTRFLSIDRCHRQFWHVILDEGVAYTL